MKLVKSLQKTLHPFTKMVKKNNKLMLLLGVLLLLGLVLLVKMYMKKREGFIGISFPLPSPSPVTLCDNEIELKNIGIQSVSGGWKMIHSNLSSVNSNLSITGLKEARFTKGTPDPLTIIYCRSDNTFKIHAKHKESANLPEVEWSFVWSSKWIFDGRTDTGDNERNAEFRSSAYTSGTGNSIADKMSIFYTEKDSDGNPKYKIAGVNGMFLGWWSTKTASGFRNAAFKKDFSGDEFYFIDTNNNNAKIDLFAKISEKEKTNKMSGLKTKFGLDVQPTDIDNAFTKISEKEKTNKMSGLKTKFGLDEQPTSIDNAFTKINTKYTTDFKTKLKTNLGVELTDTNTVNNVVGKAQTKYDGLQTVLKNQGFMYRPTPAPPT